MDLFEWQKLTYLIIVDYYSRFIGIAKLDRATTEAVIQRCKNIFSRPGIFDSNAFCRFSKEYQFCHINSSPYYPRSNGEAERRVKTVKALLK